MVVTVRLPAGLLLRRSLVFGRYIVNSVLIYIHVIIRELIYFFPFEFVAFENIGFYPLLELGRSFFSLLNIKYF